MLFASLHRPNNWIGLVLAGASFVLLLAWAFAVRPLNAPDEPAHLQAVMLLRETGRLPEIHFDFSAHSPATVVGQPASIRARMYAQALGIRDELVLTPYESSQPPLYYICAAAAS